ncbi:hypothetical protein [Deinococcus knuensis]|uniref:Uncharacterized protein n=1 Tax=Deinococcus knuensis TaxID=1837380 RepID=A0ABQ2SQT5_9DEIO|nr:hypothetical protein [Deinococcus knuensis]GGS34792.1 hypothetical protein GCM10008961_28090 [Deinococcus knuensis]
MDDKLAEVVEEWKVSNDYLFLAKYLKDTKGISLALLAIRDITELSIQETKDLLMWQYYGGRLSDSEFQDFMLNNWHKKHEDRNIWIYDK